MQRTRLLILLAMTAGLYACTSVSIRSVGRKVDSKTDDCTIAILTSPPHKSYEQIGMLDLCCGGFRIGPYEDQLREAACAMGGDAVIVGPFYTRGKHTRAYGSATVIKFLEE